MQIFPRRDVAMWGRVWMSRFGSLDFDKEYIFGFETLIFATLQILYTHKQLVTLEYAVIQSFGHVLLSVTSFQFHPKWI